MTTTAWIIIALVILVTTAAPYLLIIIARRSGRMEGDGAERVRADRAARQDKDGESGAGRP